MKPINYNNILAKIECFHVLICMARVHPTVEGGEGVGGGVSELKGNTFQIVVPFYPPRSLRISFIPKLDSYWIQNTIISWVQYHRYLVCDAMT